MCNEKNCTEEVFKFNSPWGEVSTPFCGNHGIEDILSSK